MAPACKLCGNAAKRELILQHTVVWKCLNNTCQLQFCDPQPDPVQLSEAYSHFYYPKTEEARGPIFENTTAEFFRELFAFLDVKFGNSRGRCLDFGCGRGNLSRAARESGWTPTGIENDPEARRFTSEDVKIPAYENTEALLRAEPCASFELIILWQVIEHLRAPWVDLEKLHPLLKPGGWIVIATPNAESLKARLLRANWENYKNPTHLYYFSMTSLMAALRKSGFMKVFRWQTEISYQEHNFIQRAMQRILRPVGLNGELLIGIPSGA
jgi:2-polyprenyl-3-methyl-5-hydroxy-6-metoxy-1,4-benzoquinol methylase